MRAARRRRKGQPRCPLGLSMHRARDCSSPAVHPSPQFQHKTGSPSGRPLDRKSSVSHRAPLAGHRPNSAPARQNGTEHAGRKEGAHRWRPSVGQSASGEGAPREIPVGLELSFLPSSSSSRGGGATRRDAMRCLRMTRAGAMHTQNRATKKAAGRRQCQRRRRRRAARDSYRVSETTSRGAVPSDGSEWEPNFAFLLEGKGRKLLQFPAVRHGSMGSPAVPPL